jgi:hypothetical protein
MKESERKIKIYFFNKDKCKKQKQKKNGMWEIKNARETEKEGEIERGDVRESEYGGERKGCTDVAVN